MGISNEMKSMLIKVGWKKDFIEKNTPVLPISGWMGDNLLKKSENMPWWKCTKVYVETTEFHVDTLYDVLDKVCKVPSRPLSAAMRMPISGIFKIKGLDKNNMPRSGDVMVYKKDTTLGQTREFN